jgi:hypothetical protein
LTQVGEDSGGGGDDGDALVFEAFEAVHGADVDLAVARGIVLGEFGATDLVCG